MAASPVNITTDKYGERLFVGAREVFAEDGETFDVLASTVPDVPLSEIPVGVKLNLCDRVIGSNDLCTRRPHAVFENSAEHGIVGHLSTAFFATSDDIEPDALRVYLRNAINAGQRALTSLQESGRLLCVEHSIYDDIGYLTYTIKLYDQSFADAEAFMSAIDLRVNCASEPPTLFVCHASEDKPFVDRLVRELDRRALFAWYDKREILVGDSIVEKINDGLSRAGFLAAVLSPRSVSKPWVVREIGSSLMRQLGDENIVILPILIEHCDLPALLTDVKYADFTFSFESGLAELVASIRSYARS